LRKELHGEVDLVQIVPAEHLQRGQLGQRRKRQAQQNGRAEAPIPKDQPGCGQPAASVSIRLADRPPSRHVSENDGRQAREELET